MDLDRWKVSSANSLTMNRSEKARRRGAYRRGSAKAPASRTHSKRFANLFDGVFLSLSVWSASGLPALSHATLLNETFMGSKRKVVRRIPFPALFSLRRKGRLHGCVPVQCKLRSSQ